MTRRTLSPEPDAPRPTVSPSPVPSAGGPVDEVDILARTLWGEARGEGAAGMEAVAAVVMNRVALARIRGRMWWGDSVAEVCRKPWQFSCWNERDPNRAKLLAVSSTDPVFALALRIARRAAAGGLADPTRGATHYHARGIMPGWAAGQVPVAEIGRHLFYAGIA